MLEPRLLSINSRFQLSWQNLDERDKRVGLTDVLIDTFIYRVLVPEHSLRTAIVSVGNQSLASIRHSDDTGDDNDLCANSADDCQCFLGLTELNARTSSGMGCQSFVLLRNRS